jgi:hypothetical protein
MRFFPLLDRVRAINGIVTGGHASGAVVIAIVEVVNAPHGQGLTLVHFSAQLELCLTQENTLHTQHTPNNPLTRATQPLRAPPIPYKALNLS